MDKRNIAYLKQNKALDMLQKTNTATVTLTDPRPNNRDAVVVTIEANLKAVAQAVLDYSIRRCLPPSMIEMEIEWPEAADDKDLPVFLRWQAD